MHTYMCGVDRIITLLLQCYVTIVTSDLLEDQTSMKDVWKYVTMRPGVPSVMDLGQPMMLMLPVGNLDMQLQVKLTISLPECVNELPLHLI